jgi:general secretion pathway protein E
MPSSSAFIAADDLAHFDFRRGSGCGDCRGTGYRGRKAVAEILNLNDELRELIIEKRPIRQLKEAGVPQRHAQPDRSRAAPGGAR